MRKLVVPCITMSLALIWIGVAQSGDDDGRSIVNQAIKAAGGEKKLAKFQSAIMKEKGTYYGMGKGIDYTSVMHMKWPGQFKMEIVGFFTLGLDGDKGWTKKGDEITDMPKEQVDSEQSNQKAGWIASLAPLKDKAFALKSIDAGDKHAGVEVSRKGYPTVKLYFDKKTSLLVKSEYKTKPSEQKGKEVLAEVTYSDFKEVDGCKFPHHIVLKHDGKLFVEADITEMKAAKLDAKTFAKPAAD